MKHTGGWEAQQESEDADQLSDATGLSLGSLKPSSAPCPSSFACPVPLRLPAKRKAGEINVAKAEGLKVRPIWLTVSKSERYLLLEDTDTGDVLLPLIYMKTMFEANYSRKLSSLKHRLVTLPKNSTGERPHEFVYWQWAFESPHEVKVLVRKMLGEENTPQGHLRLILLPIVFNAMAQKAKLRQSAFFVELEAAVKASSYWPLLKLPLSDNEPLGRFPPVTETPGQGHPHSPKPSLGPSLGPAHGDWASRPGLGEAIRLAEFQTGTSERAGGSCLGDSPLLFPKAEASKERSWAEWKGGQEGTLNLMGRAGGSSCQHPPPPASHAQRSKILFHGPFDIERTMSKYCLSYEAAGAEDSRKTSKMAEPVVRVSPDEEESAPALDLEALRKQGELIQADLKQLRGECQQHMAAVTGQLQGLKDCLTSFMSQLEGKLAGHTSIQQLGLRQPAGHLEGAQDQRRAMDQPAASPAVDLGLQPPMGQSGAQLLRRGRDAALACQAGPSGGALGNSEHVAPQPSWIAARAAIAEGSAELLERRPCWGFDLDSRTQQLMPERPAVGDRPSSHASRSSVANEELRLGQHPLWGPLNSGRLAQEYEERRNGGDQRLQLPWVSAANNEPSFPHLSL